MRVKAPTKIDGWTKEQLSNKDHGIIGLKGDLQSSNKDQQLPVTYENNWMEREPRMQG